MGEDLKKMFSPLVSGWALLDPGIYLLRGGGVTRSGRISLCSKQSLGCALRLVYLRITSSCWTAEVVEQNLGDHILPHLYHILPHNPRNLPLHTLQPRQGIHLFKKINIVYLYKRKLAKRLDQNGWHFLRKPWVPPKVTMQGKLFPRGTHLLYCSVWNILVIGNYYVINQNYQNLMLLTSSDTKHAAILVYKFLPERTGSICT